MAETIITIICSFVSLGATIIIALVQYKQSKRMENLAKRQDDEEKRRREQYIKAQRDIFIIKYYNDAHEIFLLPLCWIASIYKPAFSYKRKMYMEFNMLEQDIQEAICQYMNLKLVRPTCEGDDFYYHCVDAIEQAERTYYIGEHTSFFYEGAKYFSRGLTRYHDKDLPVNLFDLENRFTDLLRNFKEDSNKCSDPITQFAKEFNYYSAEETIACEISAVVVKWLAAWETPDILVHDSFWIPGEYSHETIDTMEDLFLNALFCVYVYLIMPKQAVNGDV